MNGQLGGTQLYDPFNAPHVRGNLTLGLPSGNGAWAGSAAAMSNGQIAYFASGYYSEFVIIVN
jgi:hypothetical protein